MRPVCKSGAGGFAPGHGVDFVHDWGAIAVDFVQDWGTIAVNTRHRREFFGTLM